MGTAAPVDRLTGYAALGSMQAKLYSGSHICRAILYASGELKFVAISRMLSLSTSFISMGEGRVYAEYSRI